ncbi:hypothetical protein J7363_03810 [Phaeobacter italicus]|nr:hypothetical protein [Phaeobacter italicus]
MAMTTDPRAAAPVCAATSR